MQVIEALNSIDCILIIKCFDRVQEDSQALPDLKVLVVKLVNLDWELMVRRVTKVFPGKI